VSLADLSETFERTKRERARLLRVNVRLRFRERRIEHELEELRMTVHQWFGLGDATADHTLNAESATYELTLRSRRLGCPHPNFTDDGVCTLCKEFYSTDHDKVTATINLLEGPKI
jgi:hypothetical protein